MKKVQVHPEQVEPSAAPSTSPTVTSTQVDTARQGRRRASSLSTFLTAITHNQDKHKRYSVKKFKAFERYLETAGLWRVIGVILFTPIGALIAAVMPSMIQLQDPNDGILANPGFLVQLFVVVFSITVGVLVYVQAGANIPKRMCSDRQLLFIASLSSTLHIAVVICLASAWRFPIPFLWGTGTPLWMVSFNLAHLVVLRGKLFGPNGLIAAILVYAPGIVIQFSQIFIYVAFSAIFERSKQIQQVAMALLFPFVKYAMRKLLRKYTKQLGDRSGEISASGIEICATLYQSMIMQAAPSGLISGLIMAIDVVQGLFTVKMFMDKNSLVPQDQIIATAFKLIRTNNFLHIAPAAQVADVHDALNSPLEKWKPEQQQLLVRHAFELAAMAETILLMEYFEFSIPLTNAVFIATASQFPSAHFDSKLDVFIEDPSRLPAVLKTVVLYSFLQLLSFGSMHFVMKSWYNLSALHHIAFTLEYHARSIQGKLIAWLILVFHFNGTHYGTYK
uniref:Uncharacterized protein n=1 Tax=Globisporangium ultimum (strain ATCC 200006 / CBS 805.95 / DAOM BR144) TaxID=431595 RepID=K3X9J7_GLOUD